MEGSKRGKRILRKEGERYDERSIVSTVKCGDGDAIVWGYFWGGGFGPLEMIDTGFVDQETCISALDNRFYPWFTSVTLHQERDFIFQEDGASCHTGIYARWWKETHQIRGFEYWLAQSTDLNPIEHVWNALERRIKRKRLSVKNLEQLKVALREEWERMDDEFADRLVQSMKRRCEAVIKAKGGMDTSHWRDVKLATAKCICAAADTDNDDLLAAETIQALSGRLIRTSHGKRMLEDSFAHQYLDPILETIFGSDECLKQDWANGALLPTMKRKRNDDDDNAIMDDGDDNNTEADVDKNRDVAETVYKPDWAVFANGNPVITVIGTLELEVLYKRNPGYMSDYVKLAKK
ncbi:hypothetical protein G6F52_011373 [Rhizopus delemar]|nr:hypothetical protein G6F52_011373 [Rhizopus delemar]